MEGIIDRTGMADNIAHLLMDADEILGFDYSCIILFGMIACVPIGIMIALRLKRRKTS